ncbi:MAG: hypothetical protein EA384_12540 [Spirochaetaceae bacterium]|nr:MAG: hypothetical protein EA384_12540 [Spirochaetaceae bacterium]
MKHAVALGCVLLLSAVMGAAQSNEALDDILQSVQASYGQAAYLLLTSDGSIEEHSSYEHAAAELQRRLGPVVERHAADALTLGEFALLVQMYHDLPRGLMGRLVRAPRYAVRDLRFLRVVQGRSYPNMRLSGERMVRIMGRVLAWQEGVL